MAVEEMSAGLLALQLLAMTATGMLFYYVTLAVGKREIAGLIKVTAVVLGASRLLLLVVKAVIAVKEFLEPAMRWLEKWGG